MTTDQLEPTITLSSLERAQSLRISRTSAVAAPPRAQSEPTLTLASLERAHASLRFARRKALAA